MRYWAAIPLICWFLIFGSGAVGYVHSLEHQREDAALAISAQIPPSNSPVHDDTNCQMHAQLHMPMISVGYLPLLVCLGVFVAFLSMLTPALPSQRLPLAFNSRGPPAC